MEARDARCPACAPEGVESAAATGMECHRIGDHLVIAIDIGDLAGAARHSQPFYDSAEGGEPITITDAEAFADAVAESLNDDDGAGGTAVTRMFDAAFHAVVESGADAIEVALPGVALSAGGAR